MQCIKNTAQDDMNKGRTLPELVRVGTAQHPCIGHGMIVNTVNIKKNNSESTRILTRSIFDKVSCVVYFLWEDSTYLDNLPLWAG